MQVAPEDMLLRRYQSIWKTNIHNVGTVTHPLVGSGSGFLGEVRRAAQPDRFATG
ncbi:hypothetical protein Vau01_080800 [Virgisporangium aurantiacum]|uniref:Uncharacterized protein n=1 Tax=Virgisporangium aurantiacum TaxID=175570 RepID=A0A8J4E401_9ACTN|nr:hypothetical protein Vau01_080800 [Virgisporangium aurantiacum]